MSCVSTPWKKRPIEPVPFGETQAQGTLEYALTIVALLSVISVLGLLWRAGERGALTEIAERAASHGLEALGALDIALF